MPQSRHSQSRAFSFCPPRAFRKDSSPSPSATEERASTTRLLPLAVALRSNDVSKVTTPSAAADACAFGPARTTLARAPALHSAACRLSDRRSPTNAGTAGTALAALSRATVMFIRAPAAYSLAIASPPLSMAIKLSMAPPSESSCLTSGHRQERFIMPRAASPIMSLSRARSGGPAPADHTASQDPSSAASIARAWAACRLASSVRPFSWRMATSDGTISGAC
mmetsp:Transcript_65335/g.142367  ORF Transcript_65335/g.142367 Transcript_65335/m.142367 type:complete len:224 (-) Transcript_65335:2085-2756(-)